MRDYEFYYTQDGSIGLYSYADDDVYHSKFGALTEAWEKFVIPSGINDLLNTKQNIRILDVCYGIGYNTKALMSFIINQDEKFFKKENIFKKIFKNLKKLSQKKIHNKYNIESIGDNKYQNKEKDLSTSIDSINDNNNSLSSEILSKIKIDCLDINEELVKLSPLLKTVITPQEIYTKIVPSVFNCFDTYWHIKKFISKCSHLFLPKNSKKITELLDLKFRNDYDEVDNEYRINNIVNYIIIDALIKKYGQNYLSQKLEKSIRKKNKKVFFNKTLLKYAKFKQKKIYNMSSGCNLSAFLHNIYYEYLSKRYKKADFEPLESLFELNFFVNDARKSILSINEQYDYIFLDAFTYSKAPELWTVEFMQELYKRLSPRGLLMTYSNSALVRNTFLENNFYVGKIYNEKTKKFIGTIAAKDKSLIEHPLSNSEIGLCNTKAGIPYHDENLSLDKATILKRREYDFKNSDLITSSQYMKLRAPKNEDNNNEI